MDCVRICSWDVGIKNLAYCIIKKEGEKYTIEDWDLINLIEEKEKLKCCGCMKNSLCKKNAHMTTTINDNVYSYCKRHSNQFYEDHKLNEDRLVYKVDEKHSCSKIVNDNICDKVAYYKTQDDTYLCANHRKAYINNIKRDYTLKNIPKNKCSGYNMFELSDKLFNILDKKTLLYVDEVLIENQPTLKNPTMKTISTFLYSYFMIRGIIDKDNMGSKISNVRFISPSNKLKVNQDKTIEVLGRTEENKKYKLTKQLSIEYAKILLKDELEWLNHLEKYSKKDDLCDALLQGYHYLSKTS